MKLRENLAKKAVTLNRPLVIGVSALIACLILWSLISAFEPRHDASKAAETGEVHPATAVSPMLAELPKNYQDVNGIKKFLTTSAIPSEVSQELNQLRSQESSLQSQLAQLQTHPATPASNASSTQDSLEARKSDLFFQAGKPPSSLFDQNAANKSNTNGMGQVNTPYAQQNMQAQKVGFLTDTDSQGDVYNHYQMIKPLSPYEVQAGTIIAANLLTAINTSLPGDIIAQVRQDVYDTVSGQYLLIPKGSKLLGKYDSSVAYGQERILIAFDRIVRPDGTSIQLSNFTGSDSLGEAGFEANVDNHWGKILGAATISTMLSFGAGVVADRNPGTNNSAYYPSAQQGAITGAAGSISQTGQSLTNRAIDIQPTLTVPAGFNFNVIVNKDMILEPYAGKTL